MRLARWSHGRGAVSERRGHGRGEARRDGAGGELQLPAAAAGAPALPLLLLLAELQPYCLSLRAEDRIAVEDGLEDVAAGVVVRIPHRLEVDSPVLQVVEDLLPRGVRAPLLHCLHGWWRAGGEHGLGVRQVAVLGRHRRRHHRRPGRRHHLGLHGRGALVLRGLLRPWGAWKAARRGVGVAGRAHGGLPAEVNKLLQGPRFALDGAGGVLFEGPGNVPLVVLEDVLERLPRVHAVVEDGARHV
mmetsp:Transcript_107311/g.334468  ORF Transcript_107311/g.334468 Transcript_107311/m.334468 type:complete len:244 (+) Transcript_107311:132-863(+)